MELHSSVRPYLRPYHALSFWNTLICMRLSVDPCEELCGQLFAASGYRLGIRAMVSHSACHNTVCAFCYTVEHSIYRVDQVLEATLHYLQFGGTAMLCQWTWVYIYTRGTSNVISAYVPELQVFEIPAFFVADPVSMSGSPRFSPKVLEPSFVTICHFWMTNLRCYSWLNYC